MTDLPEFHTGLEGYAESGYDVLEVGMPRESVEVDGEDFLYQCKYFFETEEIPVDEVGNRNTPKNISEQYGELAREYGHEFLDLIGAAPTHAEVDILGGPVLVHEDSASTRPVDPITEIDILSELSYNTEELNFLNR